MYIGPWQEYNLSRSRASHVDERLRPSIEQALLSTLDPETAQKAMEAMIPYFNKPSAPAQARSGGHQQTTRATRKRTIHTLPHIPSALSPSPAVISARERNLHASSPLSVRSSQSEPIRYSNGPNRVVDTQKRPKTPEFTDSIYSHYDSTLPSIKQVPPHTQPAYNSPAMLTLLRLERNSNNQARNQIAKLTGWKSKETEGSISDKNSSSEPIKASKESANEAKVEQVNKMKQLYMSGGVDNSGEEKKLHFPPIHGASSINTTTVSKLTLTNLAQHNSGNYTHNTTSTTTNKAATAAHEATNSVVEHDETVMQTPRVGDVDLDDAAFNLVSKYFQSGTNDNIGIASSSGSYSTNGPLHRTLGTDASAVSKVVHEGESEELLISGHETLEPPLTPAIHKDSRNDINLTPHPRTPAQGYEDFGGIDGLLAWSSQLELDIT